LLSILFSTSPSRFLSSFCAFYTLPYFVSSSTSHYTFFALFLRPSISFFLSFKLKRIKIIKNELEKMCKWKRSSVSFKNTPISRKGMKNIKNILRQMINNPSYVLENSAQWLAPLR